ncbi:hypothetical protein D3C76_1005070 [compost metagenome]
MLATRLVVVVLPWVPATATPWRKRISSASISARRTTGMRSSRAASNSGLSCLMAVETTTTLASFTCSALCPTKIWAPRDASRSVTPLRDRSEPEIW